MVNLIKYFVKSAVIAGKTCSLLIVLFSFCLYQSAFAQETSSQDLSLEPDYLVSDFDELIEKKIEEKKNESKLANDKSVKISSLPKIADERLEKPASLAEILSDFEVAAQKIQKDWNIAGMAVAISIDGKIVYKKVFGIRDAVSKEKVNYQTIFQIGSCTKAFTAMLAGMLADRGIIKWDDRVIDYIPTFQLSNPDITKNITIEDLLSQNSGLIPYSQHFMLLFGYSRQQILQGLKFVRTYGKFRQSYGYQNNLFLLAGEVMQYASGFPWEENLQKLILTPLKMDSTTMDYQSYVSAENKTKGHYWKGGSFVPASDKLPYNIWPYTFAPAGGINTNIDDFSKWLAFLTSDGIVGKKRLISQASMDRIFSKKVFNKESNYYYCLGWRLSNGTGEDIFWHGGTTDMQGAYISFIRDKKIGVAVLMNLNNVPAAQSMALMFYDAYLGKPKTDWNQKNLARSAARQKSRDAAAKKSVKEPIKPLPLERYAGSYRNNMYGAVIVKLENGKLKFSAGSYKTWLTLKHTDKNTFGAESIPGWTFKQQEFKFQVDKTSTVISMTIADMSDSTDSLFKKQK
ncbi:MAG: serine hydrolase [Elusimicrobiota bacterium]|jgi:CubicO group peptidase (beta-lactamase class C family)|nr:serine hydrolase [Elusimicrobiota bacterium]